MISALLATIACPYFSPMRPTQRFQFRWLLLLLSFAAVSLFSACKEETPVGTTATEPNIAAPALTVHDWLPLTINDIVIRAQFAITPSEMARGLMQRHELGENDGMLFLYEQPRQMSFWMKNTPLPLDIGYFTSDGTLREVYRMFPYDTTAVSSVGTNIQFALEMNQGWFARNGLKPGAKLNMDEVKENIRQRGHDPARYGL